MSLTCAPLAFRGGGLKRTWRIGRRSGLKIRLPLGMRVQVPPSAPVLILLAFSKAGVQLFASRSDCIPTRLRALTNRSGEEWRQSRHARPPPQWARRGLSYRPSMATSCPVMIFRGQRFHSSAGSIAFQVSKSIDTSCLRQTMSRLSSFGIFRACDA